MKTQRTHTATSKNSITLGVGNLEYVESTNRKLLFKLLGSLNFTYRYKHHEKLYVLIYLSDINNECSVVSRWQIGVT